MRLCSGLRRGVCKGEMSLLLQILFWVAMFGTVTSTIYCLMVIGAAVRFGVRKRREDRTEATFLPALSVLKPLHGVEPGLERNIESFFELCFQGGKFLSQLALVPEQCAHFEKCSHDENAHLHSMRAVEDIRGHDCTVFGEGVWQCPAPSTSFL